MNELTKSIIRMRHWLDHNFEHLKGYEEVAKRLTEEGMVAAAQKVQEAINLVYSANDLFSQALDLLLKEGPAESVLQQGIHSHPHEHKHSHEHVHLHQHPHAHDNLGRHSDQHDHEHSSHDHGTHDHSHDR